VALAVAGIATIGAAVSYEHESTLVRAPGESCLTGCLEVVT
jgi:hypothetical protein